MTRFPTAILEGRKLPRIIFSARPIPSSGQGIASLMRTSYEMGAWCFDLPSSKHLEAFSGLKNLTDDDTLIGLPHIEAEEGATLWGTPLHRFESKVVATIKKNVFSLDLIRNLKEMGVWNSKLFFPASSSPEVFTQKEIDRIAFDLSRFDKALSSIEPKNSPFLVIGERYGDWLLGLGRVDLLKQMVVRARQEGFIPIFSGRWATFLLPKAEPLDVAAYAIPINKKRGFFDLSHACDLIKKFDRPVISLNSLADGELLEESEEAFSFLFDELKICSAIAEVASGKEVERILKAVEKVPSLIPHRKA